VTCRRARDRNDALDPTTKTGWLSIDAARRDAVATDNAQRRVIPGFFSYKKNRRLIQPHEATAEQRGGKNTKMRLGKYRLLARDGGSSTGNS
jgi:hypothetical protein